MTLTGDALGFVQMGQVVIGLGQEVLFIFKVDAVLAFYRKIRDADAQALGK